jgi:hypothetical protein
MNKALTQAELNSMGCGMPNCTHDHSVLFLHARCHLQAGTEAEYEKATGVLTIRCNRCKKLITRLKIAEF